MPDITMCARDGCPLGPTCLRNITVTHPKYEQSWATFDRRPDGGCDHRLEVDPPPAAPAISGAAAAALAVQKGQGV